MERSISREEGKEYGRRWKRRDLFEKHSAYRWRSIMNSFSLGVKSSDTTLFNERKDIMFKDIKMIHVISGREQDRGVISVAPAAPPKMPRLWI